MAEVFARVTLPDGTTNTIDDFDGISDLLRVPRDYKEHLHNVTSAWITGLNAQLRKWFQSSPLMFGSIQLPGMDREIAQSDFRNLFVVKEDGKAGWEVASPDWLPIPVERLIRLVEYGSGSLKIPPSSYVRPAERYTRTQTDRAEKYLSSVLEGLTFGEYQMLPAAPPIS